MRKIACCIVLIVFGFLLSTQGLTETNRPELVSLADKLNISALTPLVEQGEICLIHSDQTGKFKQATIICLVDATPKDLWCIVTDYERYMEFMPKLANISVLKRQGNDVIVAYELDMPGPNFSYTLHHRHRPTDRINILVENEGWDIRTGSWRWEFIPGPKADKTLLIYYLSTDVRESSWLLKQALKSQPNMEHGINVATGLMTVKAIKNRAER